MLLMLAVGLPLLATAQPMAAPRTLRDMADCCAHMGHQCPPARSGQQRDCCQQRVTAPQPAALTAAAELHAPAVVAGLAISPKAITLITIGVNADITAASPPASPPTRTDNLRI